MTNDLKVIEWNGKPISKPGIYSGIPIEEYHEQLTVGPSISSSGLRSILSKSPAHYFWNSYLNDQREPDEDAPKLQDKRTFAFGKAAHAMILGDDYFDEHFVVSPYSDFRKAAAQEFRDTEQRTIIKQEWVPQIKQMRNILLEEPVVIAGALQGEVEYSIVWQDKETGVWKKARPDVMPHDDWVVDYKTTANIFERQRRNSIVEYGYHMQMAMIAEGLAAVGRPIPANFVLIFQEKDAPFSVVSERLSWELIRIGAMQNREATQIFRKCLNEDDWPGPEQPSSDYGGPEWFQERMRVLEDNKLIPEPPAWVEEMVKENRAYYQEL